MNDSESAVPHPLETCDAVMSAFNDYAEIRAAAEATALIGAFGLIIGVLFEASSPTESIIGPALGAFSMIGMLGASSMYAWGEVTLQRFMRQD